MLLKNVKILAQQQMENIRMLTVFNNPTFEVFHTFRVNRKAKNPL